MKKIKHINLLKNEYKKKNKRDKGEEEYPDMPYLETEEESPDMPYLETEEEAPERIADLYEHRDDTRKTEEKHVDTSDLESEKKSSEKINEDTEDIEESEESEEIEHEKIDMEAIDYLYENMMNHLLNL